MFSIRSTQLFWWNFICFGSYYQPKFALVFYKIKIEEQRRFIAVILIDK